jgi:O-antigen ligase
MTITKFVGYLYFLFTLHDLKRFYAFAPLRRYLWPLFSFFILLTVMSLANYNVLFYKSMNVFDFSTFQCIILFWGVSNHLRGQRTAIYRTLLFFMFGAMMEGVLFYLGIGVEFDGGRLSILGANENDVGIRMALAIMVLLSFVFENPFQWNKKRYFLLAGLTLLLPVLALTGSRTSLIILTIGILILTVFIQMANLWRKIVFLIVSAAGIFALVLYFAQFDTLKQRVDNSIYNDDTAGRTYIWQQVLPIFYDSPIVGVGMTGYASKVIPIFGTFGGGVYRSPHNVYMEILCYTGIVGLVLYLLFMARLLKVSWSFYKKRHYLLPAVILVMILVMMFAGQGLYNKSLYYIYAVIVALSMSKSKVLTKKNKL